MNAPAKSWPNWTTPKTPRAAWTSLRGTIRLAIPIVYGTREVIPRLAQFLALHPLLQIDCRWPTTDRTSSRKVPTSPFAWVTSTIPHSVPPAANVANDAGRNAFISSGRGVPKTPADLATHDCISGPGNFGRDNWSFTRNGTETSVNVRGRIHTNSGPGVFASAMAGLGIAMVSTVMAGPEVKAGTLVALLRSYSCRPWTCMRYFRAVRGHRLRFERWWISWRRN